MQVVHGHLYGYSDKNTLLKLVRFRDNETIKSKETSSGLRRHIKTSLNAFHTVGTDDYSLIQFSMASTNQSSERHVLVIYQFSTDKQTD